ncbi:MAG TPA: hypothetical protein VHE37_16850, partial [Nevskiaceae bacterium]|nr:hypothetical protein [Nevskiaceae bacterium]
MPANLEAQVEAAVDAFRAAATSPATWESYSGALRYVCAWAALRFGKPLEFPVPASVAKLFVIDHFGQPERINAGSGRTKLMLELTLPAAVDQALVDGGFKAKLGRLKMSTIDHRLWVL